MKSASILKGVLVTLALVCCKDGFANGAGAGNGGDSIAAEFMVVSI